MNTKLEKQIRTAISEFLGDESCWNMSLNGTDAVYQLEQRFSQLIGHPHALAVINATSGLWAVFMALEIHDADIITAPYTWGGSLAGLILTGNRPVFADINKDTLTIDPESVIKCVTSKTKAILAVDIYGFPCNGEALRKIADDYGLIFIHDCAQSIGAYISEQHTAWYADVTVFSLGYGKALFAGESSVIVTRNRELYDRLVWQTQHPYRQMRDIPHCSVNEMAMNMRIHPLAAIWAVAAFDDALKQIETRRQTCLKILKLLTSKNLITTPILDFKKVKPSFHKLTFEPNEEIAKIEEVLRANGWNCSVIKAPFEAPIYDHDAYRQFSAKYKWPRYNHCPVAEQQCKNRLQIIFNKQ